MTELVNIPADDWTLHGIVHCPKQSSSQRVGVLLYHENYNTKIGTHRLFRDLSDRLASAGFYALRYDDRGMCDSPGICDLTIADRLDDARAAARFFRVAYKLDVVIGWGLCLGATTALHTSASSDPLEQLDALILCSILADPGIATGIADLGGIPMPLAPAEFGKLIANEIVKWGKVIKFANIKTG